MRTNDVPAHLLQHAVEALLQVAGGPLRVLQLERALEQVMGLGQVNTFDVRDAVWALVHAKRAAFTPNREVTWTTPLPPC
jgi:hypothetical protein